MRHFHLNPVCTQVQNGALFQINSDKVEVFSNLRALIKERFSKDIWLFALFYSFRIN